MKRHLLILVAVVVLLPVSSFGLARPMLVRAASCTTTRGFLPSGGASVYVAFSAGDTISATWPVKVVFNPPNTGVMKVDLGPINFTGDLFLYTITVCASGAGSLAGCPIFFDGRLNNCDPWETSAIYCLGDGSVRMNPVDGNYTFVFQDCPVVK